MHIYWTLYPYHVDIYPIPGKGNNLVHQSCLMAYVNDESVCDLITFYDMDAWQTEWQRSMVDQSRHPYPLHQENGEVQVKLDKNGMIISAWHVCLSPCQKLSSKY